MGAGTGAEVNEVAQDRNGDGSGNGAGTGTETRTVAEMGTRTGNGNRNEDRIGEGGRDAKKRNKPQNSCRRHDVGNGGDLDGKKKM